MRGVPSVPQAFSFPSSKVEAWTPLRLDTSNFLEYWGSGFLPLICRIRPEAIIAFLISLLAIDSAAAQNVEQQAWNPQEILRTETYVKPPAVIERIIMAPRVDI